MRENPKRVSKNNQGLVRPYLQNPTLRLIIMAVVIVVVLAIILSTVFRRRTPQVSTEAGVAYIHQLEAADVAPVEQQIKDIRQEERRKALENGELDVWQQFGDAAILGDSRAVGFSVFGFVEDRRVLAEAGGTLKNIPDHIEQLQNVNPSIVFFCFGLNDISIGYWNTVEEYITELDSMIDLVKTSVPGVEVYVNSTIPATDPALRNLKSGVKFRIGTRRLRPTVRKMASTILTFRPQWKNIRISMMWMEYICRKPSMNTGLLI